LGFNPSSQTRDKAYDTNTGNLNSETSGDSENAFLHCGDVSDLHEPDLTHKKKRKVYAFSDHNGSLSRQQPGAIP